MICSNYHVSLVWRCITKQIDISRTVNELVAELRHQHPDRQVQVTIQPGLVAYGDTNLLRVALENLLSNAWKFTCHTPQAIIEVGRPVKTVR